MDLEETTVVRSDVILDRWPWLRIGASRYVWDLPAGGLETDRSPLATAKRELLEETGYESDAWYPQ